MIDEQSELERRVGDVLRYAVVDSVDLGAKTVMVKVGDKVLGPFAWFMPRCGETVIWSPPSVGEQGLLLSPEGYSPGAVFFPGVASSAFQVPAGDPRALVISFKDGATVSHDAEGHLLTLAVPAAGGVVRVQASKVELGAPS